MHRSAWCLDQLLAVRLCFRSATTWLRVILLESCHDTGVTFENIYIPWWHVFPTFFIHEITFGIQMDGPPRWYRFAPDPRVSLRSLKWHAMPTFHPLCQNVGRWIVHNLKWYVMPTFLHPWDDFRENDGPPPWMICYANFSSIMWNMLGDLWFTTLDDMSCQPNPPTLDTLGQLTVTWS